MIVMNITQYIKLLLCANQNDVGGFLFLAGEYEGYCNKSKCQPIKTVKNAYFVG